MVYKNIKKRTFEIIQASTEHDLASKIFDKDVIQNILNLVNDKIYLVSNKIIDREFEINPKKIGIKNLISCEHCNYKEICYMTEENIINLKEYKNLEFLKGDQNEMD